MADMVIAGLGEAETRRLGALGQRLQLAAGQTVFAPGRACAAYLLVTAGSVRVSTMTEIGREVVLYRVGPGEACVLTTSCLLAGRDYDAFGAAETEVEAIAVPKAAFENLLNSAPNFRRFVFNEFSERLREVIAIVQEVAERHVDRRLARYLLENGRNGPVLRTHQAIAAELGTAREVVSRLLKEFSGQGMVRLERGCIVIADAAALDRLQAEV